MVSLNPTANDTKQRVATIMESKREILKTPVNEQEDCYQSVAILSAKMFSAIRFFFAKYVRVKLNAFFLHPL